ncbi:sugar phosphate isomerase/epimerase family protein [Prosthecobacter sp.]|uniref:sugar phosphate isomerase/epimerase family protein n=1 Tax=Prosthecobacter sp. TaxID=1965333 RepID=UPI0024878CC5|nr:sugar phosphate isomerase/epimerase family protein [Prosthecobacter sp.]MDI1314127.1 sugar phosphate isomerase/epimerase [Prosthecobacter sp.]
MTSRRQFIHSLSSTALLAASGSITAQEAAKPARKLRKAIMGGTLGIKGTLLEKYKAAKEAGYEGVEPAAGMNQQEVLDALGQSGLQAASVCCHTHWKQTLTHDDPKIREEGFQGVLTTLRDAKAYGTDSILVVPGVVSETVPYDVAWTRSIAELKKAVPLAKELGVKISIENVWNNFILSPLEAVRYLDEIGDPIVGWHFDIGNVLRFGWPEQWIKILGKRINRIHVKEYSTKKMKEEGVYKGFDCNLTEGDNNWPAIMKALDDVGYTGWAISEQRGGINPGGLKMLTERMDKIFAM